MIRLTLCVCLSLFYTFPLAAQEKSRGPLQSVDVYPATIILNGPRASQHLGVLGHYTSGDADLTLQAKYTTSDPAIIQVNAQGIARPGKDGKATITVTAGKVMKEIPVEVTGAQLDIPVAF